MSRPSLYLTLLQRNLADGMSWVEASDLALSMVAETYLMIKQSVLGPPQLGRGAKDSDATDAA